MSDKDFGNLGGIIMADDIEQCKFKYKNGVLLRESVVPIDPALSDMPIMIVDVCNQYWWDLFFSEQIVPRNRYRLLEDLADRTPIRRYIPEQILRWGYCRNCANHWWVKVDDDLSCWEDWQIPEVKKYFNIS